MTWWPDGDNHADRTALSALEHYAYCPRQAALIHVDGTFTDDVNTAREHLAHDRVDRPGIRVTTSDRPDRARYHHTCTSRRQVTTAPSKRGNSMRQHHAVPVWSATLGLYERCNVIETNETVAIAVEDKIGAYRPGGPADVQVAARAMCLREMLDLDVPQSEVFTHADRRRRHRVELTGELTAAIHTAIAGTRSAVALSGLPTVAANARCRRYSLIDDCLPHELPSRRPVCVDLNADSEKAPRALTDYRRRRADKPFSDGIELTTQVDLWPCHRAVPSADATTDSQARKAVVNDLVA